MSQDFCTSCSYIGEAKTITKGSVDTEIILWFCFLIPGLIYSIWRHRSQREVCSACDQTTIIPADSHEAQQIINEKCEKEKREKEKHEEEKCEKRVDAPTPDFRPPSKIAIGTGRVVGRLVGSVFK